MLSILSGIQNRIEKVEQAFDRADTRKVILVEAGLLILLGIIVFLFFYYPLQGELNDQRALKASLAQELELLQAERPDQQVSLLDISGLPLFFDSIQQSFTSRGLQVKEIFMNQPVRHEDLLQIGINLTVGGDQEIILQTLNEIQQNGAYPLITEEINQTREETVIRLLLLARDL